MRIGIPRERGEGQTLVSATPDTVRKLKKLGYEVMVESDAGLTASIYDCQYEEAGAQICDQSSVWQCDMVTCLDTPADEQLSLMHPGSILVGRMNPSANPELVDCLSGLGITSLAMDMIPRISRAQSMDVRSSMANVAGYRAVVEASFAFGRLFGGQVTAAGKIAPAKVYIVGVGVAGLAAIGTAKSMGAIVSATDVRSDVAEQVASLDAEFVPIPVVQESSDGYAKEMTADQAAAASQVYAKQAAASDIVITTAQIPGKKPPLILDAAAVNAMRPGSVIVDMGAGPQGGNCELTRPGEVYCTENGVTIVGLTDLPARLPNQASQLYGQNIVNFLGLVTPAKDGQPVLDMDDEVVRGVTVTLEGSIMWPPPPVKVSVAAPASQPEATAQQQEEAQEAKPAWKRWWWKIALGILAIALVLCAPEEMAGHFFVFELACVVGFYVITNVTHTLHTPLMSVTNAISGIIIVGALLQIGTADPVVTVLAFLAATVASINIFGGFLVTHRMLGMFQRSSE